MKQFFLFLNKIFTNHKQEYQRKQLAQQRDNKQIERKHKDNSIRMQ